VEFLPGYGRWMRVLGGRWERAREEEYGKPIAGERASVEK